MDKPSERFLTEDEIAARYRGLVSAGTLRNWRAKGRGPPFVKVGRSVLYPLAALEAWEVENTCCAGPRPADI
jgi:hypothetical protein